MNKIFELSGDQRGKYPNGEILRSSPAPPTAGAMYKPPSPSSERYAMYLPSGDQSGCQLLPGLFVICTGLPPLTCCTQMSNFPPRSALYAMYRPSGDHVAPNCRPSSKVKRVSVRWYGTEGDSRPL